MRQEKLGFLLPEPIDGYDLRKVCICIPDSPLYVAAFFGHIKALMKWWTWEKSGVSGDHRAVEAAAYWRSILAPQMNEDFMCCCDNYNSSQMLNLMNLQQAQRLIDADTGSYLSFAPDAPDTSFSSDTTDTTSGLQSQRLNALCGAIQSYLAMEIHYWTDLINTTAAIEAAAAGALLAIPGFGVIAGIVAGAAVGLTQAKMLSILTDTDAINRVVCDMYNGLLGKSITLENFKMSLSGLYGDDGSNEDTLAVWLGQANQKTENYHAFTAFLGSSFAAAAGSPDMLCDCADCEIPMRITTGNAVLRDLHDCRYSIVLPAGSPVFVNVERIDGLCFHAGSWSWSDVHFGATFEPCGGGTDLPYFGANEGASMQQLKIYNNHAGETTVIFTVY